MNEENTMFEENLNQDESLGDEALCEESVHEETSEESVATEDAASEDVVETSDDVSDQDIVSTEETTDEDLAEDLQTDPSKEESIKDDFSEENTVSEEVSDTTETSEEISESIAGLPERPPYHERYYLRYGEGKRTMSLDLEGTRSFLQDIGFDGGELHQARKGKDQLKKFQNPDQKKKNQMCCSYCGSEISGVEFYRMPDGRLRCTSCTGTIVKTKTEVEELCNRVINNMDSFFGATIDVPVSIEVLDERKLKKKIGVPLGTKDSQSMLILGVAINKKKKYHILLENGAPRISLIATFAHELTHIWQYTHWDAKKKFKKCSKSKRLLIYEGMAKWVEIQYLYLIGETEVARREERITRNRKDEYGLGFCLYEDYYPLSRETMTCDETPFTPDSYPF